MPLWRIVFMELIKGWGVLALPPPPAGWWPRSHRGHVLLLARTGAIEAVRDTPSLTKSIVALYQAPDSQPTPDRAVIEHVTNHR